MTVLAGDIGGTHARLALVDVGEGRPRVLEEREYPSAEFAGLAPIVQRFLADVHRAPERAAFGVAGPVVDGAVATPNLPWALDERRLAATIGVRSVRLLNDLDAIARGVFHLGAADVFTLQEGTVVAHGAVAFIGAGTGLGEAFAVWNGVAYRTFASEGGHAGFAPNGPLERELLGALAADRSHVSIERVLSGPGLVSIYRFLAARSPERERQAVRDAIAREGPAVVSRHALAATDPLCVDALDLFARVYGVTAGNLALTVLATGGVYLVGGIAPAISSKLADGAFLAAFRDKGRLSELMHRIPVHVVMNGDVGLYGAAMAAAGAPADSRLHGATT